MGITTFLEKIEQAKALEFGDIFNRCIELFKKVWLQGLVMLLLTMLFMLPFYILMYAPLIAMGILNPEAMQGTQPDLAVLLPFYLFMLLFMFFVMVIVVAFKAAFYRICKTKDLNEASSDDYFYFLKKAYLGKTLKIAAITYGITLLAMLLCFFPLIYVMVPVTFISVVYAFNPDMQASDIVKLSFKLGNKKWLITFGLMFVTGFLAQTVGMLLCFVGIFVTAAFAYLPVYFIYKDVIGLDKEQSAIDEIGTSEE